MQSASVCISSKRLQISLSFSNLRSSSFFCLSSSSRYCSCFPCKAEFLLSIIPCWRFISFTSSASRSFKPTASLLLKDSFSFSIASCFACISWYLSNNEAISFSLSAMSVLRFFCSLSAASISLQISWYFFAFSYNANLLYLSYTLWIFCAACCASWRLFKFIVIWSIFSIASDIGRRSSSESGCRESLKISLMTEGLKSFDSFGVRSWISRSIISLYSSTVSNPKIWRLTYSI